MRAALVNAVRPTRSLLARFRAARSGLAALEFALILPMMLVLYVGGVEVNDAISIRRKLNHAASTLADLAAQSNATVTAAALSDLFYAGNAVMKPYDSAKLKPVIAGVAIDDKGKATIAWAKSANGATCPAKGSAASIPASLATPNSFLIMVDASYAFTPKIGYVLTGTYNMDERVYQQPRIGKAISGPDC